MSETPKMIHFGDEINHRTYREGPIKRGLVTDVGVDFEFQYADIDRDEQGREVIGLGGTSSTVGIVSVVERWKLERVLQAAKIGWGLWTQGRELTDAEFEPLKQSLLKIAQNNPSRTLPKHNG